MEMPEGWKRIYDENKERQIKYEEGLIMPTIMFPGYLLEAMKLMKEMAEALDQACGLIESEWGPLTEDEKSGVVDKGGSKPFIALKNFKGWS